MVALVEEVHGAAVDAALTALVVNSDRQPIEVLPAARSDKRHLFNETSHRQTDHHFLTLVQIVTRVVARPRVTIYDVVFLSDCMMAAYAALRVPRVNLDRSVASESRSAGPEVTMPA